MCGLRIRVPLIKQDFEKTTFLASKVEIKQINYIIIILMFDS